MQIQNEVSLKTHNTFGIEAYAKYFSVLNDLDQLPSLLSFNRTLDNDILILGGGSNILFTKNYDGLVVKNELPGIDVFQQDSEHVYVKVGAGVGWHDFVVYCLQNNYAGVENLALIPGNTGASPMQNIGAYGVEIKDVFHSLDAVHIKEGHSVSFNAEECNFGYRESVFKNKAKGEFIITSVSFKLNRRPSFNISYGVINQELERMKISEVTITAVADAVMNIRRSKLPDPKVIGNAGSFFKNPEVELQKFEELQSQYPNIVAYPVKSKVKLAAGWLIEQCGWKGFKRGDAGCHAKQALVLVNYKNASGNDIYQLSAEIMESVKEKFGVQLEREVNIY